MSTPDQPDTPALTRRRLREIRNTGATTIVSDDAPAAADPAPVPAADPPVAAPPVAAHAAPLPRAADPVAVAPAPGPDAGVDLGVAPLTRRQAREQERIRTASVPVITPDLIAAHAGASAAAPVPAVVPVEAEPEPARAPAAGPAPAPADDQEDAAAAPVAAAEPPMVEQHPVRTDEVEQESDDAAPQAEERPIVHPRLGADLREADVVASTPSSFDALLAREGGSSGSVATPNALILSQAPASAPLAGPIASTGEILITGTYELPEGLGSQGHVSGKADGKEVDAVLVDGELPAHSSPTPIAASAAISTVKGEADIVRPPAPEKGSRLMMTLAITAGALALALVGVLILAFTTGVF